MPVLMTLPVELLYEIQLFATSSALPQTCKALHAIFTSSPPSYRAQYLAACVNASDIRRGAVLTKILRYPICTKDVLEVYLRSRHPTQTKSGLELPRRLFRALVPRSTWSDQDPPLPLLRYLYTCPLLLPADANSHQGYALTKAVLAGFVPLVRFLLDHGATPAWKGHLPIIIAIRRRDLGLVKMLVEGTSTGKPSFGSAAKVRVELTPAMLRTAVKCKSQDIIEYLTKERGCIPDMQTLLMMG